MLLMGCRAGAGPPRTPRIARAKKGKDATIGTKRRKVNDLTVALPEEIIRSHGVLPETNPERSPGEMLLRALLFDFDGVLADTENLHVAAWQRTFAELGWEVPDEVCMRAVEEDDRVFLANLFAARRIAGADVAGWVLRKQALTVALLQDSPRLYPGVAALVHALRGRLRLAVVTGTWRGNVAATLRGAGLEEAFELIVAKEDVEQVKPHPECYQLALKRLGLEPAQAVALEDSPTGLAAARGAGVRAVAVGHRRGPGDWVGAGEYLENLRATQRVLAQLGLE